MDGMPPDLRCSSRQSLRSRRKCVCRYYAEKPRSLLDDRQFTHLICVRLRHLLYDFFRGRFGPFISEKQQEGGPKRPLKSHVAKVLSGHRLDE